MRLKKRLLLVSAYYDLAISHGRAVLVREELYKSAFALMRPMQEAAGRVTWCTHIATDEEIERLTKKRISRPELKIDRAQSQAVSSTGGAADQGNTSAQFNPGLAYDIGEGVPKDAVKAAE